MRVRKHCVRNIYADGKGRVKNNKKNVPAVYFQGLNSKINDERRNLRGANNGNVFFFFF